MMNPRGITEESLEWDIMRYAGRPLSWPYPVDVDAVRRLVYEGLRIGRVPWSADSNVECGARQVLQSRGDFRQESMDETCERRAREQADVETH